MESANPTYDVLLKENSIDDNSSKITELTQLNNPTNFIGNVYSYFSSRGGSAEEPWKYEHRDLGDGGFRAAIFGFSDGLVTNLCLILGVEFALDTGSQIIVTGISGLLAGGLSMAVGEWISMKAQAEALEAEIKTETRHLELYWDQEMEHLRKILRKVRLSKTTITKVIGDLKKAPREKVVELHARLELGIDPEETGKPVKAAIYSFLMFSLGAVIPILPYVFLGRNIAWKVTLAACIFIGCLLGFGLGRMTKISAIWTTIRQFIVIVLSAGLSLGVSIVFTKQVARSTK